jgi:DNA polymerase-3 subunit alpha
MKDLIRRLQPDTFEDIVALVALFRPGPLQSGMVDDFIARKHGAAPVAYTHPDLEPILKPSYGVILYQEQVMQIAQVLAGYTLGEADLLRRAMGKKKPAEMAKQRVVFMQGAAERSVAESTASHIFDLMEKFAGYGFNKSHSAAYALIAYQTAWLKAHHAAAYMAAVLSADMDHTDKVVVFVDECRALGLTVLPPNVNDCQYAFTVQDESTIRYGLGAIKGVGKSAIDAIIAEREGGGAYRDLFDFCERIDMRRVNRRVVEALIRSGALNDLGPSRAAMMRSLTQAMQAAEQTARDRSLGQNDLFGEAVQQAVPREHRLAEVEEWSEEERLVGEKETLGLYLTGHPIARFEDELAQFTSSRLVDLKAVPGQNLVVAGLVVKLTRINSRSGRGVSITLDDRTARVEAVLYAEEYQHYREIIGKDKLLVAVGEVTPDSWNGGSRMVVRQLYDMTGAREAFARVLRIQVDSRRVENEFIESLAEALEPFREGCTPVCIEYLRPGACVKLPLGTQWRVRPSDELLGRLRRLAGEGGVALAY